MASKEITQSADVVNCDSCQNPVSFFCRRCGVNLCDACTPEHLRLKARTSHDVVDYESKDDDVICFCDLHPIHELSVFCRTCDVPICVVCIPIKHKTHEISELSEKKQELLESITRENDRLQSFRQELERILAHTTNQLSSLSLVYQKRKDEVTTQAEEWHTMINNHVKKLHLEIEESKRENEKIFQKHKHEFEKMIEKIEDIIRKTTHLQKSKNVTDMQKFKPIIKEQKPIEEFTQYTFPVFHGCKLDDKYLQNCFGYIDQMQGRKISLLKNISAPHTLSEEKLLEVPFVFFVIDTGFPADKVYNNRLYDMALTNDKKVWMGGESKELKLFDLQGELQRTVHISDIGMYICKHTNNVLYTDRQDKTVKKISEDTVVTMFATGDWNPKGITGTASSDLLVCLLKEDQSKVVRYSSTGTVLQEIQYDSQCRPLYQHALYIAENVNGDIIITDYVKNKVIAVDRLGIFRYSYSGEESCFSPMGVATDSMGNTFVADFMLDRDGQFMRHIIPKDEIKDPRTLLIVDNGEMIVEECFTGLVKRIKYLDEVET